MILGVEYEYCFNSHNSWQLSRIQCLTACGQAAEITVLYFRVRRLLVFRFLSYLLNTRSSFIYLSPLLLLLLPSSTHIPHFSTFRLHHTKSNPTLPNTLPSSSGHSNQLSSNTAAMSETQKIKLMSSDSAEITVGMS